MNDLIATRAGVTALDPHGMLGLTEGFAKQCRVAHEIALQRPLEPRPNTRTVVLTGLGGSAAGGDFVRALFEAHGSCPFSVNRDYHLPAYIDARDLVFCASYSGNTEETLSAYADAKAKGANVIVVSSGGTLSELAKANGDELYTVPGGQPPRTAMGFMMIPVLVACEALGLLKPQNYSACFDLLDRCVKLWTAEVPINQNPTKQLALAFHGKLPVFYGLGVAQAVVASRWKSQIHENSKTMAFANGFPELNHNEILGWEGSGEQGVKNWVGAILKFGTESSKMLTRAKVTTALIGGHAEFHEVQALGDDLLSRLLSLAMFGDFVSIYLARLAGVDPEDIGSINKLKEELAKVS